MELHAPTPAPGVSAPPVPPAPLQPAPAPAPATGAAQPPWRTTAEHVGWEVPPAAGRRGPAAGRPRRGSAHQNHNRRPSRQVRKGSPPFPPLAARLRAPCCGPAMTLKCTAPRRGAAATGWGTWRRLPPPPAAAGGAESRLPPSHAPRHPHPSPFSVCSPMYSTAVFEGGFTSTVKGDTGDGRQAPQLQAPQPGRRQKVTRPGTHASHTCPPLPHPPPSAHPRTLPVVPCDDPCQPHVSGGRAVFATFYPTRRPPPNPLACRCTDVDPHPTFISRPNYTCWWAGGSPGCALTPACTRQSTPGTPHCTRQSTPRQPLAERPLSSR
jgi:hypothetical protein